MIAGNFAQIGNVYSLCLRTIDVETGKVLKNITFKFRGSIEDVLLNGLGMAVAIFPTPLWRGWTALWAGRVRSIGPVNIICEDNSDL